MDSIQIEQTLTDDMVERAVSECVDQHFAGDINQLSTALLQGQLEHCRCITSSLVMEISRYLGQTDKTIKAIVQYEPTDADQIRKGEFDSSLSIITGVNLVVWAERKSAALTALVDTLESVLSSSYRKISFLEISPECLFLDVKIVDDQEVENKSGLGLLFHNAYMHVKPSWTRPDIPDLLSTHVPAPPPISVDIPEAFDPEIIPESRLIEHAFAIERIPPEERVAMEPHLTELKVILIRRMISDQLTYISIAKRWFTISDMQDIYQRRIGNGRVGGKAAGMLLAARILDEVADDEIKSCLRTPESYFLGSELIYIFMSMNGLLYWNDQKYKDEELIREEYPFIQEEFQAGELPPEIVLELQELLVKVEQQPIIVRSSSQLEDNFGTSFAGKYDSYFCPNQGSQEENLTDLTNAITRIYASTLKPDALLYRRSKGLQDYDERMAVLIQVVEGQRFGRYFFPAAAGVGFSRNIYRWSPQILPEDGFVRLVWGLGTRAVQRLGDDYPRLVALSHPELQPDDSTEAIRHYSQHQIDLLDLEDNRFKTLPIHEVLKSNYPPLNLIAQIERDGFHVTPRMRVPREEITKLSINFNEFLHRTKFAKIFSSIMRTLEEHYYSTLDVEFTVGIPEPRAINPPIEISLLQCRPQSHLEDITPPDLPEELTEQEIIFSTDFMVPRGYLSDIRHILYIHPEAYFGLPSQVERNQVSQTVAKLNSTLDEKSFICIGPGRWGSTNLDLGVYVSYADIHNAAALIELSGREIGTGPEPSLGTHFFQDLMEAHIYPLAIPLDDDGSIFNHNFFEQAPNAIESYLELDQILVNCLQLVDISTYSPGCHLEVIIDDEASQATAFLVCQDE